ncbi:Transposable element P transposase [Lucilia cuprina]|nr:Transposable element P transposase [Lucilia cuprina]
MTLTSNARICIDHFFRKDIITAGRRLLLMPNAVPNIIQAEEHLDVVVEDVVMEFVMEVECLFNKVNGRDILHIRKLQKYLVEKSRHIELSESIRKFYFKCRIYFRVRNLNKRLKIQKQKQRLKGGSKMVKIKL